MASPRRRRAVPNGLQATSCENVGVPDELVFSVDGPKATQAIPITLSEAGLTERAALNAAGDNEGGFLDPLREVVASGMTFADRLLERYHGEWAGDVSKVYDEFSF